MVDRNDQIENILSLLVGDGDSEDDDDDDESYQPSEFGNDDDDDDMSLCSITTGSEDILCTIDVGEEDSLLFLMPAGQQTQHNTDTTTTDLLTNLNLHLTGEVASFLSINDMFAMNTTCKTMLRQRSYYRALKAPTFELVKQIRKPRQVDYRSTLEPFSFLFKSPLYGIIQVDFSIVNVPTQEQQQLLPHNAILRQYYGPPSAETDKLDNIRVRINIQKKFPPDEVAVETKRMYSPMVIFRLDQSLPGCSFHFDSKYICHEWQAGHLSLISVCAHRLSNELKNDVRKYPSPEKICRKFTCDMRDNVLRCIRNRAAKDRTKHFL